jgi:selenocysteine-specific elongation factor
MSKEEIRSKFLKDAKPKVAEEFMDDLINKDYIEQKLENLCVKGFEVKLNDQQLELKDSILNYFKQNLFQPPRREDISELLGRRKEDVEEVFSTLVGNGDIMKINEELYILKEGYNLSVEKLREYISDKGSISIGEFRDLLNTNRKVSLGLLEYFDQIKITKRDKDSRTLN